MKLCLDQKRCGRNGTAPNARPTMENTFFFEVFIINFQCLKCLFLEDFVCLQKTAGPARSAFEFCFVETSQISLSGHTQRSATFRPDPSTMLAIAQICVLRILN